MWCISTFSVELQFAQGSPKELIVRRFLSKKFGGLNLELKSWMFVLRIGLAKSIDATFLSDLMKVT
jgi:hypothetical protein